LVCHGMILVEQDVRGKMLSEGTFVDVRPRAASRDDPKAIDESTDAWDTIDWLVKNAPGNNGKVGIWGNSYPGFYAAQALIGGHPALVAASPQAPVTDWFLGDDFHHNGALFLADTVLFFGNFGKPRPQPVPKMLWDWDPERGDLYDFFLGLGTLANINKTLFHDEIPFWNDMLAHPNRDAWWQARDPRPHLKKVTAAVLTVGGWFDAEDLWGTLETYRAIEAGSLGARNAVVIGPWRHGGWLRTDGASLGDIAFGAPTTRDYQNRLIVPFFLHHLKGEGPAPTAEASVFETGTNVWRSFGQWPPAEVKAQELFLAEGEQLAVQRAESAGRDRYVSDPRRPVPYRAAPSSHRGPEYMVDDQRFAAHRPDVLVYTGAPLEDEWTVAGPIDAELWVATAAGDADFVVKVIDVWPANAKDSNPNPRDVRLGGYQQLIRAEVMRGRFRNDFSKPEPFVRNQPARVALRLPDVLHTFRAGHRLMVQIQSSWFPLVDRNPQTFVEIAKATEADFQPATIEVLRGGAQASKLKVGVLRGAWPRP
ncbi:MAG: CocE/NonD family hydrolase, partial [Deltaproteobacteria bacterium]|nr:CocE/NonD family hydrolase [Deltaproteobacteria bacterium]